MRCRFRRASSIAADAGPMHGCWRDARRAQSAERRVRQLRERPRAAAGAVARRQPAVRGQHAGQPPRHLHVGAGGLTLAGRGAGRPRAGRGRRPQQHRGLGGEPPLRQREHRDGRYRRIRRSRASRARSSPATSRATSSSPGRAATAPSSPRRGAGRTAPCAASLTTPGTARAHRAGLRRDQPRRGARRHADREHRRSSRDTPRALARTPDGSRVFAAVVPVRQPDDGGPRAGRERQRRPAAAAGRARPPATPATGLIVKFNGSTWVDEINRSWNAQVPFNLPDRDVFIIDANADPPALVSGTSNVVGVGHRPLQHGGAARTRATSSTSQHRRAEQGPLRAAHRRRSARPRRAGAHRGEPHHGDQRHHADAAPPEPAHRLPRARRRAACRRRASARPASRSRRTWCSRATASGCTSPGFGSGKVGIFDAAALEAGTINAARRRWWRSAAARAASRSTRRATGST